MSSSYEVPCNCLAVRQAARQLTQLYDAELAPVGLRVTQYSVLASLARLRRATMQELADALVMDRTTLSHNLKPLERDGLVSVGIAERDSRARVLELTPLGKGTLQRARKAWQRAQERFEKAFGPAEAKALRRELRRAVTAAS
jgi:DNA-binding MarR family transcriptional regulator